MDRVAIYARVSSEEQAERGTLQNQVEFATKYCDLHQLEITQWYKDDGITGTIPLEERPEGRRLLEDARAHKFDLLLIYRLDRLGRAARVILNSVHELEEAGVKVKSMEEPFDTGDPSGRFLLTILAGVADLERTTILERMTYGANRAARQGKWLGGNVPYGYKVNADGFLEVNEDPLPGFDLSEADVIRLIYRLLVDQGMAAVKISDYLNALKIPTAYTLSGKKISRNNQVLTPTGYWRPSRIATLLRSPVYCGVHTYGKVTEKKRELITRQVPAIVPKETWDKAQKVLASNKIEAFRNSKRKYLLRGLVRCGVCGLKYCGISYTGPQGTPRPYYICHSKNAYNVPSHRPCNSKNVPAEWLEALVWDACVAFIENPGDTLREWAVSVEKRQPQKDTLKAEYDSIQVVLREKEGERAAILDLYRRKVIGVADVEAQLQKITQEGDALNQRTEEIKKLLAKEENLSEELQAIEGLLAEFRDKLKGELPFDVKRTIIKALVKEVIIDSQPVEGRKRPRAKVVIHFSFSQIDTHARTRPVSWDSSITCSQWAYRSTREAGSCTNIASLSPGQG